MGLDTYFRHCGVTGTVTGCVLISVDLLLCDLLVLPVLCFFTLFGTSLEPEVLSDLFLRFIALVTLLKVDLKFCAGCLKEYI